MEMIQRKTTQDQSEAPWYVMLILLVAFIPATGNRFLYSFILLSTAQDWGVSSFWSAIIGYLPMAATPIGGFVFGSLSDRYGRRNALLLAILVSGCGAGLTAFASGPLDFFLYRVLLGMSTGGQWAVSMTLVSESYHPERRGRAVGVVQTSFPVGFLFASLIAYGAAGWVGWRGLLLLGALPVVFALPLCLLLVRESPIWIRTASESKRQNPPYREIFRGALRKNTLLGTTIMFLGAFGAWSVNPWIPVYLGDLGIPQGQIPWMTFLVMLGALPGYLLYGVISDRLGRKATFRLYFSGMALALIGFGFFTSQSGWMGKTEVSTFRILILGMPVTFFLGYFSGYGALFAELFPTRVRSRGIGFCYTMGGIGGGLGPAFTGHLSAGFGMGAAFMIAAVPFLIGSFFILLFPETRGKELTESMGQEK